MNDTYFFKTANDFFYDTQKVSWGFIYSQFRLHLALKPNDLYLNTQFKKFKNCYTSSIERVYEKKQFQTLEELESWVEALKKEKLYEDHLVIVNEESLIVSVSS